MSIEYYERKYQHNWIDFLNPKKDYIIPIIFDYYPMNTSYCDINFNNKDELKYWSENYPSITNIKLRDYIHYYVLEFSNPRPHDKVKVIPENTDWENMTAEERITLLFE